MSRNTRVSKDNLSHASRHVTDHEAGLARAVAEALCTVHLGNNRDREQSIVHRVYRAWSVVNATPRSERGRAARVACVRFTRCACLQRSSKSLHTIARYFGTSSHPQRMPSRMLAERMLKILYGTTRFAGICTAFGHTPVGR
jgi:hypothetical protein